jgi:opacity protein-like surface antigen
MNKTCLILGFLVMVLCVSTSSYGEDTAGRGLYISVGASYAISNFDQEVTDTEGASSDSDFDDTWGINLKAGYHLTNWLSVELDFDSSSDFESDETLNVSGACVETDGEVDVTTYMAVAKFTCVLEPLKPFIVAGGGLMNADINLKVSTPDLTVSDSESETELCMKLGLGADYFVTETFSIGIEGGYVWAFQDLDDIGYTNVTLGVGYHF